MTRPVLVRRSLTVLVVAAVATVVAVPAWALFSVLSTDATGVAAAGVLGTPVVTTSGVTATSVTFTIAAPATGTAPTAYRVARTAPTPAPSVCTVTGASGSCTDTTPVAGSTNTYAVYAALSGSTWESPTPRGVTVSVPSADTTAPVTTASASPAPNAAGWNGSAVTVTLSATDGTGVSGTWYTTDGSTPTSASTAYTDPFTVSSSATVRYFSVDTVGNPEAPRSLALKVDAVAPTGAVTAPASAAVVTGTVTVSGTAADTGGSGVAGVQPQVQQGSGAWADLGSPVTTGASTWSTSWATTGLTDGAYTLRALVTDVAGGTTTTATRSVTVQNTLVVTAPSSAVAGTAFSVTIRSLAGVTGSQPITVTGLASSPNGTAPTVPTSATFTGGVATISVTPTKSGAQTVTVRTTADGRHGTSGSVVVAPKAQGQLYFTSCTGTTVSCPANSATASVVFPKAGTMTYVLARRGSDDYGNSLLDASVTVTLVASSGTLSSYTLTLAAGASSSATQTYTPPGNSGGARTIDATGTTSGVATASARLTVDPN
jgi:hypothetical protein